MRVRTQHDSDDDQLEFDDCDNAIAEEMILRAKRKRGR